MMDRLLRREATPTEPATPDSQLHALLARVRRRWRMRVALRGLALALAGVVAVVVLASVALEQSRWADDAVVAARVVAWLAVVALLAWWVARPLVKRVPAQKVALYLEEHEPSLDAALVSAVEQVVNGLPSVLPIPDVIYCVRSGQTPIAKLKRALDDIERTGGRIRGIVLWNAPDPVLSELRAVEQGAEPVPATV